jgi:hypothetical protein
MIGPPGARAPQESVLGQEDTSVDLVLRKGFLILGSPGGEGGMGEEGTKGRENGKRKGIGQLLPRHPSHTLYRTQSAE